MANRIFASLALLVTLGACSGAIYRQSPIKGATPVAITVDARQRVLLSQIVPDPQPRMNDPQFRRFCAEPSPDVFTVMAVSGSGGGVLGLGANQSLDASLQAAFSSSETGATISRTQTLNMLREMMFRTCERYLSGAITPDEFPIIAARDQRIMVSIMAIEQLTGSITPRGVALTSGGNASTGLDPTEMVKLLAAAQESIKAAEDDVVAKTKKLSEADVPAGNCATLRKKKADGTPALTADETTKLSACETAQSALNTSVANRDLAQARYDDLVAASKRGMGVSSATTSTVASFSENRERSEAVIAVALSVEKIVASTFAQDETQLFCIRALNSRTSSDPIYLRCMDYLLTKIEADRAQLQRQYRLSDTDFNSAQYAGAQLSRKREVLAFKVQICAANPTKTATLRTALLAAPGLAQSVDPLLQMAARSRAGLENYLFDQGPTYEDELDKAIATACN